jgi:hypothetical protein
MMWYSCYDWVVDCSELVLTGFCLDPSHWSVAYMLSCVLANELVDMDSHSVTHDVVLNTTLCDQVCQQLATGFLHQ